MPIWSDNLLPSPVREFVSELSNATETPKELGAFLALSVIATAAQGKYRVKVKPHYFEPVNILDLCGASSWKSENRCFRCFNSTFDGMGRSATHIT